MKRAAIVLAAVLLLACRASTPAPDAGTKDAGADARRPAPAPAPLPAVDAGHKFGSSQPGHIRRAINFVDDGGSITTTVTDNDTTGQQDVTINFVGSAGGVSSVTGAGTVSCSPTTGAVVCTGTNAVSSVTGASGVSCSPTTGAVSCSNTGVTSVTAGNGISLSGSTGAVTITNTMPITSASTGSTVINNTSINAIANTGLNPPVAGFIVVQCNCSFDNGIPAFNTMTFGPNVDTNTVFSNTQLLTIAGATGAWGAGGSGERFSVSSGLHTAYCLAEDGTNLANTTAQCDIEAMFSPQ